MYQARSIATIARKTDDRGSSTSIRVYSVTRELPQISTNQNRRVQGPRRATDPYPIEKNDPSIYFPSSFSSIRGRHSCRRVRSLPVTCCSCARRRVDIRTDSWSGDGILSSPGGSHPPWAVCFCSRRDSVPIPDLIRRHLPRPGLCPPRVYRAVLRCGYTG